MSTFSQNTEYVLFNNLLLNHFYTIQLQRRTNLLTKIAIKNKMIDVN
jgi:hypothetical protein